MSIVKDMSMAEYGRMKIEWVQDFMPALSAIKARFEKEQPFKGLLCSFVYLAPRP